jgi:hypothetical protein
MTDFLTSSLHLAFLLQIRCRTWFDYRLLRCPDTSPRNVNLPGEDDSWDFGSGAGFYLDATAMEQKLLHVFVRYFRTS